MKTVKPVLLLVAAAALLAACDAPKQDKTVDNFVDNKHLSNLKAGIWIDPEGCDHWIIDDGAEGYLTSRRYPDGRPVCSGQPGPGYATGPFKSGSSVPDPI